MAKVGTIESYAVDTHPRHCKCDCLGFLRYGRPCRHVLGLRALEQCLHGIQALRMVGLAWDVKVQKLSPGENTKAQVPPVLAA